MIKLKFIRHTRIVKRSKENVYYNCVPYSWVNPMTSTGSIAGYARPQGNKIIIFVVRQHNLYRTLKILGHEFAHALVFLLYPIIRTKTIVLHKLIEKYL